MEEETSILFKRTEQTKHDPIHEDDDDDIITINIPSRMVQW
jgi:hypothetical protein